MIILDRFFKDHKKIKYIYIYFKLNQISGIDNYFIILRKLVLDKCLNIPHQDILI